MQLVGGSYADERVRLNNPLAVAYEWCACGFARLHVVDLDGATGRGSNAPVIRSILRERETDVQVGGGLRTSAQVESMLDDGARYVIVGTRALEDLDWLAEIAGENPGQIILAADVKERRVVTQGWQRTLSLDVFDLIDEITTLSLGGLLVTAVHKEGQMQGTDLLLMEDVVESAPCPVLAAGGVGSMNDLHLLRDRGVSAAVIGMALYTGALDPRIVAGEFAE